MSLARRHQARILALTAASAPASGGGLTHTAETAALVAAGGGTPAERAAATISMRLAHDLRRLKEIKAISAKIIAKRAMLPEYQAWCDGLIDAGRQADGRELASTGADDVLPTIMVWCIDVGDWTRALMLADFVLRFDIAMPARYERDAATLVLEEIAEAALKAQVRGEAFPLYVLEAVERLVDGIDMHDEPRAKLLKAIGTELARVADQSEGEAVPRAIDRAIDVLARAQDLHDRVGVKTLLRGLEKAKAAVAKLAETASAVPADQAPGTDQTSTGQSAG